MIVTQLAGCAGSSSYSSCCQSQVRGHAHCRPAGAGRSLCWQLRCPPPPHTHQQHLPLPTPHTDLAAQQFNGDLSGVLENLRTLSGSSGGGSFNATDWIPELLDRIASDAPKGGDTGLDEGGHGTKRERSQVRCPPPFPPEEEGAEASPFACALCVSGSSARWLARHGWDTTTDTSLVRVRAAELPGAAAAALDVPAAARRLV